MLVQYSYRRLYVQFSLTLGFPNSGNSGARWTQRRAAVFPLLAAQVVVSKDKLGCFGGFGLVARVDGSSVRLNWAVSPSGERLLVE